MKRHRRDLDIIADLNLTNLLDVTFVLLLVFMIVAPQIKQGMNVRLPRVVSAENLRTNSDKPLTISVRQVTANGQWLYDGIYISDRRIEVSDLPKILQEQRNLNAEFNVIIEADREVKYETVAQVLATLRKNNVMNVGLPTVAPDTKDEKKK